MIIGKEHLTVNEFKIPEETPLSLQQIFKYAQVGIKSTKRHYNKENEELPIDMHFQQTLDAFVKAGLVSYE